MKKRIFALALILALCLAFSGCTLESMRKSHAVNTEEGVILWNGQEYYQLPDSQLLNPMIDYSQTVYVTQADVPVLLREIYGYTSGVSMDGKFLVGWYGGVYCRSDCYEQYKDYVPGKVTLDRYCYEAYTSEGEYLTRLLDAQESQQLNDLLDQTQEEQIAPDDFFESHMSWGCTLAACTEDLIASMHAYEVYVQDGQYCFVRYDDQGNYFLKKLPPEATETLNAIFNMAE